MKVNVVRFSLLVIGGLFIIVGIYTKEVFEVLTKSINICLECIGIG